MDQDARVGERVGGSFQFDLGLADFHAFAFGEIQNRSRFVDARDQVIDPLPHHPRRGKSFVTVRMAVDAERALLRANHLVTGFWNRVIAVAGDALAKLLIVESLFVRTGLEKLSLSRVALATDVSHRGNAGRRRTVIPVA